MNRPEVIHIEDDIVLDVASERQAANRAAGRTDQRQAAKLMSGELDVIGAAAELGFARWMELPDEVVRKTWRAVDPGWDFETPKGTVDVKGTKRLNNLIYPALKYPPKMAPDWYVLAWVVNLGHSFEVELVGCCKFAHFDEVRRPVMLNTLVWFMPYSDLMPMAALKQPMMETK